MGNVLSRENEPTSALVCGCGYVAPNRADLVHHNRTVAHEHHGYQRRPGDKRFRLRRNQETSRVELTIRATEQATGETVYVAYGPEPSPDPSEAQPDHFQQLLLDQISGAAATIGPIDEETALGLASLLSDLLNQDVHHQETKDDTAAVERLAEQLGVGIGGQQEDPMEQQQQRKDHHELKRLKDNIDRPVSQGSTFNVLQYAVTKLHEKRKARIQDAYFDRTCALDHASREPGNFVPRSNYLTEKLVGVKHPREVQKHVCVNDCMGFPDLAPGLWAENADQQCTKCGQARFERRQTANGTILVPRKVFYWFGLGNVIRDRFFTDPSWCKRRGTGRAEYFYCTAESGRLHSAAGCNPLDARTSVYEGGLDWGQMFVNKVHSCGFIMVRCADMPLSHLNRRCYSHIVGIIPGPQEPKNLEPYLQPMVDEFKEFGPQGTPLRVTEHKLAADNKTIVKCEFEHTILLGGVFGDSPGIKKMARWLSHAAYLGCGYCWLRGTHSGGMYFKGYAQPTSYGRFDPGEFGDWGAHPTHASKAYCGDPVTHISANMQRARANLVEGTSSEAPAPVDAESDDAEPPRPPSPRDPSDMGCLGVSILLRELDYCDYNNLFVVPIAHAGLCGAVKDFWKAVMGTSGRGQPTPWYQLSTRARDVIRGREAECVATCDFGRS